MKGMLNLFFVYSQISKELIIGIISTLGIGTIVSAILVFAQEGKKNDVNQITGSRATWREKIEHSLIMVSDLLRILEFNNPIFSDEEIEEYIKYIIETIRDLITAYGMQRGGERTLTKYINSAHIWEILYLIEKDSADRKLRVRELELLRGYLRQLKKRDWEFSKNEVKYGISRGLFVSLRILFSIISIATYVKVTIEEDEIAIARVICFLLTIITLSTSFLAGVIVSRKVDKQILKESQCHLLLLWIDKIYLDFLFDGFLFFISFLYLIQGVCMFHYLDIDTDIGIWILMFGIIHASIVWFQTKIHKKEYEYINELKNLEASYNDIVSRYSYN
ncbi:TPA: hypothetical protein ACHVI3_001476 [Streptococcus suis]